jgi:hypothetical protein
MSDNHRTELIQWMPLPEAQSAMFSVYRTEFAIELHPGCNDRESARLICTQSSYDNAREFCELLAQQTRLPIQDDRWELPHQSDRYLIWYSNDEHGSDDVQIRD